MGETSRNSNRGEFYTPEHVSKLFHDITSKYLGENFKSDYIVWDNCWGTGNLTKGYEFENLFISTLQRQDIRKHRKNNPEAIEKFQYDFLNQDTEQLVSMQSMWMGESELPEELNQVFMGEDGGKALFYINPPYVATGIFGSNNTDTRVGQTTNQMKEIMREHKMQSACDQAYAQFMYKILLMKKAYDNKDISLAIVSPPLFLTAPGYINFRDDFLKEFKFMGGALIRAGEFEGLSNAWGIALHVWVPGETVDKKNFKFDVYEINKDTNELEVVEEKNIYNLDGETTCMDWAKDELCNHMQVPAKNTLSSGCRVSNKKQVMWQRDSMGYLFYRGNNIYHNNQECGIMTLPYGDGSGISITEDNFDKLMAIFFARRAYSRYGANWKNDKDEYAIPDINSEAYKKLVENSIVYSLFNGSTHVSSLILKNEDGTEQRVPNHFHHISADKTVKLFENAGLEITGPTEVTDRYMVGRLERALESGYITETGKEILELYEQYFKDMIPHREEYNKKEPVYQVTNWDAGYYQLKWVLKEYFPENFKKIQGLYRQYEEEIRHLVHDSGYLR